MKNISFPWASKLIACPFQSTSFTFLKIYSSFIEKDILEKAENKKYKTTRNIRSIDLKGFCIILGDQVEQCLSLFYFFFVGAWILWHGSHFDVCFVAQLYSLVGGMCRVGWENKSLWEFEPKKDGTLGNKLPHISNLCLVKGQSAQQGTMKEDLLGLNLVWNSVLWKVPYPFKPGWRVFFAGRT